MLDQGDSCQHILRNLLQCFDGSWKVSPHIAIREFLLKTPECRDPRLSTVHSAYSSYIKNYGSPGAEFRIIQLRTTDHDAAVAAAAMTHYNSWTQDQLRSCMTWSNYLSYKAGGRWV